MIIFEYKAKKTPTNIINGEIEADSESGAISKLSELGLYPFYLKPKTTQKHFKQEYITIPLSQLIFFSEEISDLINSGVSLPDSIGLIAKQTPNHKLKFIASFLIEKIQKGESFSQALSNFPQIFSPLYQNVVKSGEISGSLESSMLRLAAFYKQNQEFKSKILQALLYPFFLFIMGILAVFVLTVFVIPKLIPIFEDMGAALPVLTQIIIKISFVVSKYWKIIFLLGTIFLLVLSKLIKSTEFKRKYHYFLIKLPLINNILINRYLSEIFQSLDTLISNGISTIKSLEITADSCDFYPFKNVIGKMVPIIANGKSLSESLNDFNIFPKKVQTIIRIGEETGKLHKAMEKLAKSYSVNFEKNSQILTKFAGPFFILIIAVFIGLVVIAMLLPILNLNVSF